MAKQSIERQWHIYKITCRTTRKSYIGLTCDAVSQRWSNHVCSAKKNRGSISVLHRAIRKYGRDVFDITELVTCPTLEEACRAEIEAIASHGTLNPLGYNLAKGGAGTVGVRRPHSPETRAKIGDSHRGKIVSVESRAKMSAAQGRRKHSDETKKKISEIVRKRTITPEQRKKQADSCRGKKYPRRSIALLQSLMIGDKWRGVSRDGTKWVARIGMDRKRVHLGMFRTKEDAKAAYVAAVQKRISELEFHQNVLPSASIIES